MMRILMHNDADDFAYRLPDKTVLYMFRRSDLDIDVEFFDTDGFISEDYEGMVWDNQESSYMEIAKNILEEYSIDINDCDVIDPETIKLEI